MALLVYWIFMDAAIEKLAGAHAMSITLMARILCLIEESGASQMEAFSALNAAKDLLPSLGISHMPPSAD